MEGIHLLRDLLQEGDWMVRLDLKDAYLTIPIFAPHRRFLQFQWGQQVYEFASLPFGLSSAPWCFTKVLKPVVERLRTEGIRLIIYLDDMLLLNQCPQKLLVHLQRAVNLLESLGFIVNQAKSDLLPSRKMQFLGFLIDSVEATVSLPSRKLSKIRHELRLTLAHPTILLRHLARVVGLLSSSIQAIFPGPSTPQSFSPPQGPYLLPGRPPHGRGKDGASMVDRTYGRLERTGDLRFQAGFGDRIRCQRPGLGSALRRCFYRRSMVIRREGPPHQLSGVDGRFVCGEVLDERQDSVLCPSEDGQCGGGALHQPPWRNQVQGFVRPCPDSMGVLPVQRDIPVGGAPSRLSQPSGGLVVSPLEGRLLMATSPRCVRDDREQMGSVFSGPFCFPSGRPAGALFQLAAGPGSNGSGCISAGLEQREGLCVSPLCDDHESVNPGEETAGGSGGDHPDLEIASLVSSSYGTFLGFSNPSTPRYRSPQESSRGSSPPPGHRQPVSDGLAVYRQRSQVPGLSEDAATLLAKSWADSTNKRYRSAWSRWSGWCLRQQVDPMGADIVHVLNFLPSLAKEG
ncbi:uncharacterized protein LOC144824100 [Lissotriton helveticus]